MRAWRDGWGAASYALTFSCALGCAANPSSQSDDSSPAAQAGFLDIAPRNVVVHGNAISLAADSEIFYDFRPADSDAESRPLIVLFNGFASDVVRAFGTGPFTVNPDGSVVTNPDSLTRFANLLYIDPRQSGFSYDVIADGAHSDEDCSQDVFNEYVDAADVLLATLAFVDAHPSLRGPVYWLGESYAGVRIQWLLTYLRGAWALAPYQDETLQRALSAASLARFLNVQILLQPGFLGVTHDAAIQNECTDPALLTAVQASVSAPCASNDACACANAFERSFYNYTLSTSEQDARIFAADAAQISPDDAVALYGVALDTVAGLGASERAKGFKCSTADDTTPDESALRVLLGSLPVGQNYNLAYSPLTPGKGSSAPDWSTTDLVGEAFLDNVQHVDTLVTDGARDLVVPEPALAPTLRSLAPSTSVTETADALTLGFAGGARSIAVRRYASAGHMITMIEPHAFATDLSAWLDARASAP